MAIYNKGINKKPLVPGASTANRLAGEVAKKQLTAPSPSGVPNTQLDTTGRQATVRPPASGPLTAPTSLPAQTGPASFTDPRGQPQPDLKGVTLPKPGTPPAGPKVVTGGFVGTPPPIDVKDGKVVAATPQTEEQLVDAAVRKLLEDQKVNTEKERAAMQGEMKAAEARDIQSTRARTGLGGMGLTGAAGALESQVRTEGARKQALTTAEFDRQARQEEIARTIAGIEAKFGKDAADRARETFATEQELAREELGALRGDFPPGLEGDKAYEDAKAARETKQTTEVEEDLAKAGTTTDMPVGATKKETENFVKGLESRGRDALSQDPLESGPYKIGGINYYVYRRRDNGELYRSTDQPGNAVGTAAQYTPVGWVAKALGAKL